MRGIEGVRQAKEADVGRFYLDLGYEGETSVLQRIDGDGLLFVEYAPESQDTFSLRQMDAEDVLVALPQVQLRIDPPSLSGTSQTGSLKRKGLIIAGELAILAVPSGGFRQSILVDVQTGKIVTGRPLVPWAIFERWLLVVDEAGEELPIVSFGE